jgi:DnaJ-class molecular chaperone
MRGEQAEATAILLGLKRCLDCAAKRTLTVNRNVAGKMYTLKFMCRTCNGKGWFDPKLDPLDTYLYTRSYVDPEDM